MAKKKNKEKEQKANNYKGGGAIAGGIAGVIIAGYMRKNMIWGAFIGVLAGGYISHLAFKAEKQKLISIKKTDKDESI